MTIKEYLMEYEFINNIGVPIELKDVLNDGNVYCGGGYEQLMEELSSYGLSHVSNAKFVCRDIDDKRHCIILCYIKDIELYPQTVLENVAKRMVLE